MFDPTRKTLQAEAASRDAPTRREAGSHMALKARIERRMSGLRENVGRLHLHRKLAQLAAAAILQMSILAAVDARAEQPVPPPLTSTQLVASLNEYAFAPFGSKTEAFLVKWKDGVRLGIANDGSLAPEMMAYFTGEFLAISKLTHLRIEQKNDNANLAVVFTGDPQRDFPKYKSQLAQLYMDEAGMAALYKELSDGEYPCAGKIFVSNKKEISHYFFIVSTQGQDQIKIKACVFRELMRALGLLHLRLPSASSPTFPEDLERLRSTAHGLLAFLYRDDVTAGLSRSELIRMLDVGAAKENLPN